jgi:hypothetical protein
MSMAIVLTCGLGTFVLKLPGDIGKINVSKMKSTFCTNVPMSGKYLPGNGNHLTQRRANHHQS